MVETANFQLQGALLLPSTDSRFCFFREEEPQAQAEGKTEGAYSTAAVPGLHMLPRNVNNYLLLKRS